MKKTLIGLIGILALMAIAIRGQETKDGAVDPVDADTLGGVSSSDFMQEDGTPVSPSTGDLLRYDGTNWTATSGYVDRGDPVDFDFTVGDLITTNEWIDLDLSAIVPAGAKYVLLSIGLKDDLAGSYFQFRANGNTNDKAVLLCRTQVANLNTDMNGNVPLDSNRIIEYKALDRVYETINITITGWGY